MAVNLKRIFDTNNAFEYSETVVSSTGEVSSKELFIPSNVATVVMHLRRKAGTGQYKIQTTTSTRDEIFGQNGASPAEWFNWDIPEADSVTGYVDQDEIQWWVPITSGMRLITEAGTGTTVYFSLRAN